MHIQIRNLKQPFGKKDETKGTNTQRNEIILPEIKTIILDEKF